MSFSISRSPLDEQRFTLRVARAAGVASDNLPEIMAFCRREQVQLLIARCPVDDLGAVHAMQEAGFLLMDTLVYYACDLSAAIPDQPGTILIRPAQPSDEDGIARVAAQAFQGYGSHYHADPRLDRAACDDTYIDWAVRSLRREAASEILAALKDNRILGFITLKTLSSHEVEGPLFAVSPEAQGQGIGRVLMIAALHWCRGQAVRRMVISTQVTNRASQAVWIRLGFCPHQAYYTFHKWFTEQA